MGNQDQLWIHSLWSGLAEQEGDSRKYWGPAVWKGAQGQLCLLKKGQCNHALLPFCSHSIFPLSGPLPSSSAPILSWARTAPSCPLWTTPQSACAEAASAHQWCSNTCTSTPASSPLMRLEAETGCVCPALWPKSTPLPPAVRYSLHSNFSAVPTAASTHYIWMGQGPNPLPVALYMLRFIRLKLCVPFQSTNLGEMLQFLHMSLQAFHVPSLTITAIPNRISAVCHSRNRWGQGDERTGRAESGTCRSCYCFSHLLHSYKVTEHISRWQFAIYRSVVGLRLVSFLGVWEKKGEKGHLSTSREGGLTSNPSTWDYLSLNTERFTFE